MFSKLIYRYCLLCGICCFMSVADSQFNEHRDQTNGSRMGDVSSLNPDEIYSGKDSDDAKTYIYLCRRIDGDTCCNVSKAGLRIGAIRVSSKGEFDTFSRKTSKNIIWSASVKFGCKDKCCGGDSKFYYFIKGEELGDHDDFFHSNKGASILEKTAYVGSDSNSNWLGIESILETALFRWKTDSICTLSDFFLLISRVGKDKRVTIDGKKVKLLPKYDMKGWYGYNCATFAGEALFHLLGQSIKKSNWKWIGSSLVGTVAGVGSLLFPPFGGFAPIVAARCASSITVGIFGFCAGGYVGGSLDNAPGFVANGILSAMNDQYKNAKEKEKRNLLEDSFKIIVHTKEEILRNRTREQSSRGSVVHRQRLRTLAEVNDLELQTKNIKQKTVIGGDDNYENISINVFLNTDFTPSYKASDFISKVQKRELLKVKDLLREGTNPNIRGKLGITALMYASQNGYLNMVDLLLKNGADPNIQDDCGKTSLMYASQNGYLNIVKFLIKKGADPNIQDDYGKTSLMCASQNGYLNIVKFLMKKGADPNIQDGYGVTALMSATKNGHLDVVKSLLKNKANPNICDNQGRTALMLAEEKEAFDIVGVLQKANYQSSGEIAKAIVDSI